MVDILKVSKERIHFILHEHLSTRKRPKAQQSAGQVWRPYSEILRKFCSWATLKKKKPYWSEFNRGREASNEEEQNALRL